MHCAVCQLNIWKVARNSPKIVLKVFQFTKNAQAAMLLGENASWGQEGDLS